MLSLLADTAVSHEPFAQREFVQLFFLYFSPRHAKGIHAAFQTPQDMNIAFSSTPNTDIIYEGNHHQPWSEPCLPAPSSWPPTAFFVFRTEALCGLMQQGFNQHISSYFYICFKLSINVIAPPVVFNDVQDVHFPSIPGCVIAPRGCAVSPPQQFDEDLTLAQAVTVSSLCGWWGCQRDSVWPNVDMRQGWRLASVRPTCSRWQSQGVCVTSECKSVW